MFNLASWNQPEVFLLSLTNLLLGGWTLYLVGRVGLGLLMEMLHRHRRA